MCCLAITKAAHRKVRFEERHKSSVQIKILCFLFQGVYAGFDLAHVVGNVELHLHEWDYD